MKRTAVAFLAGAALVLLSSAAHAKCDPTGADAADVAAARLAVTTNCDCAGAANHGSYVSCAAKQARTTLINKSCKGAVVKCAAHSTCGKPDFVTCCRTDPHGKTSCSTKSSSSACKPAKNGTACVSHKSSCCDACTVDGCASPSGAFLEGVGPTLY
jgi:hypothetical protein